MVRKDRQLPDVWDPVHQLDTHEADRRVADDQDKRSLVEVVFSFVVDEWTNPHRCKQSVGFELNAAENGGLIRACFTDGRS